VSMGFSGITGLAGGVGSLIKTGVKGWPGKALKFITEKTSDYFIGEGLKKLEKK